jgi:hypothetical protein
MKDRAPSAAQAMAHIHCLTEVIGPRGSTTPEERQAAKYAQGVLHGLGVEDVRVEEFESASSTWRPYAVCGLLALLAVAIYPLAGRVSAFAAALLSALTFYWAYRELNFGDNPIRRLLPKGKSQNVIGIIPPDGEARKKVVLIGHLDSHRTPLLFRTTLLVTVFMAIVALGFLSLAGNALLYLLGALTGWPLFYAISWGVAGLALIVLLLCLQADLTPYTKGANDNASAVGVNLSLAERLVKEPLQRTEVWILCSGCEEVGCYGMLAFLKAHKDELRQAYFIDLEGVGIGQLHYAGREGMTRAYRSHPELVTIAEKVAARRPELIAGPKVLPAGYTETGVVVKEGLKGITIIALSPQGFLPYWHQPEDTLDKIEEEPLAQAHEFVWEMMREIDGGDNRDAHRD